MKYLKFLDQLGLDYLQYCQKNMASIVDRCVQTAYLQYWNDGMQYFETDMSMCITADGGADGG